MLTYGFYNSMNGDRKYNAIQFSTLFKGIITDGVFMTIADCFDVTPHTGMRVNVAAGRGWFNDTWTDNDAPLTLTIEPSDLTLSRIDAVVLEVNTDITARVNSIKMVKGTPDVSPVRPEMVKSEFLNQYPIAYVAIAPDSYTIADTDITMMVGTEECPYVTGILETVNETMLNDIQGILASVTENTNEVIVLEYQGLQISRAIKYWEDDVTMKEEQIITYQGNGLLSTVQSNLYDQAGDLKKTFIEMLQYNDSGQVASVRKVVA